MQTTEQATGEQYISTNEGFQNQSALYIRLDTTPIINKLELYLNGMIEKVDINEIGEPIVVRRQIGKPKANDYGVQSIMSWVSNLLNAQVVQGNFKMHEDLGDFMQNISNDLTDYIHLNNKRFGIDMYEINGIIDVIMNPLYAFHTRLVGNKERESYAATIRTTESTNTATRGGIRMPGFGG